MLFVDALCDSGANISMMPFSIYKRLGLPELRLTLITMQMVDRSITKSKSAVEDVLIWVDYKEPRIEQLILPVDFLIINMEKDAMPILLGGPFLQIAHALLAIAEGELIIRCFNEKLTFEVFDLMKQPKSLHSIFFVDFGEPSTCEVVDPVPSTLPLERSLIADLKGMETEVEIFCLDRLEQLHVIYPQQVVPLGELGPKTLPIIQEAPKLDLKPLPKHLKYIFLKVFDKLSIIISSLLTGTQEQRLREVLVAHKTTFAWTIVDIKGLSPNLCQHKI